MAANILDQHAKLVDAILVYGQVTRKLFFNDEVFDTLHNSKIPPKIMSQLENIDKDNISSKDLELMAGSIRKYTNGYNNKNGNQLRFGKIIWGIITSPDYCFKDFLRL